MIMTNEKRLSNLIFQFRSIPYTFKFQIELDSHMY